MWLLMAAIGLGFGFLMVPIAIGVVMGALMVGGGLGYALYRLTDSALWALACRAAALPADQLVPLTF